MQDASINRVTEFGNQEIKELIMKHFENVLNVSYKLQRVLLDRLHRCMEVRMIKKTHKISETTHVETTPIDVKLFGRIKKFCITDSYYR